MNASWQAEGEYCELPHRARVGEVLDRRALPGDARARASTDRRVDRGRGDAAGPGVPLSRLRQPATVR